MGLSMEKGSLFSLSDVHLDAVFFEGERVDDEPQGLHKVGLQHKSLLAADLRGRGGRW